MSNIDLSHLITAEAKTEAARQTALSRLANLRWRYETGGIVLENGARVSSTRESQGQIGSAVLSVQSGLITDSIAWKTDQGWMELDAPTILALAAQVSAHVQACFAAERIVADQIAATAQPAALDIEMAFSQALGS